MVMERQWNIRRNVSGRFVEAAESRTRVQIERRRGLVREEAHLPWKVVEGRGTSMEGQYKVTEGHRREGMAIRR